MQNITKLNLFSNAARLMVDYKEEHSRTANAEEKQSAKDKQQGLRDLLNSLSLIDDFYGIYKEFFI